jgi:hypothetical protein
MWVLFKFFHPDGHSVRNNIAFAKLTSLLWRRNHYLPDCHRLLHDSLVNAQRASQNPFSWPIISYSIYWVYICKTYWAIPFKVHFAEPIIRHHMSSGKDRRTRMVLLRQHSHTPIDFERPTSSRSASSLRACPNIESKWEPIFVIHWKYKIRIDTRIVQNSFKPPASYVKPKLKSLPKLGDVERPTMAFAWARRAATFASQPQLVQEKEHPWK